MNGPPYREWRCEAPQPLPGGRLVALRRLRWHPHWLKNWTLGELEPVGVVLCTAAGQRAQDLEGGALDLAALCCEVPGLAEVLAQCPGAPAP